MPPMPWSRQAEFVERFLYVYAVNGINGFIDARSAAAPASALGAVLVIVVVVVAILVAVLVACLRTVLIRIYVVRRPCEPCGTVEAAESSSALHQS